MNKALYTLSSSKSKMIQNNRKSWITNTMNGWKRNTFSQHFWPKTLTMSKKPSLQYSPGPSLKLTRIKQIKLFEPITSNTSKSKWILTSAEHFTRHPLMHKILTHNLKKTVSSSTESNFSPIPKSRINSKEFILSKYKESMNPMQPSNSMKTKTFKTFLLSSKITENTPICAKFSNKNGISGNSLKNMKSSDLKDHLSIDLQEETRDS